MRAIAIFFLNVLQNTLGMTFGWLFKPKTKRNSFKALSDVEMVKYLENEIVQDIRAVLCLGRWRDRNSRMVRGWRRRDD